MNAYTRMAMPANCAEMNFNELEYDGGISGWNMCARVCFIAVMAGLTTAGLGAVLAEGGCLAAGNALMIGGVAIQGTALSVGKMEAIAYISTQTLKQIF